MSAFDDRDGRTITLRSGPRRWPVAYAGPFVVSIDDLEENAPHGTGRATVGVRAFGIDPGILSLLEDFGEAIAFGPVVDAQGRSLKAREDVRYFGGGYARGKALENTTTVDLKNLLRDVPSIREIRGTQRLVLPTAVTSLEFDTPRQGVEQEAGGLRVVVKEAGKQTTFEVHGRRSTLEDVAVRFETANSAGDDLEVLSQGATSWGGDWMQLSVQTREPPAKVRMKLVTKRRVLEYPFALRDVPLARWSEMPEKIEPLAFGSWDAPIVVRFLGFADRDSQFPKVNVRVKNHSNKVVLTAHVELGYLDEHGKTLKDFPHTLQGTFTAQGHQPLAAKGATADTEATAFFMPAETKRIAVRVDRVEFIDGSQWQRAD